MALRDVFLRIWQRRRLTRWWTLDVYGTSGRIEITRRVLSTPGELGEHVRRLAREYARGHAGHVPTIRAEPAEGVAIKVNDVVDQGDPIDPIPGRHTPAN